MAMKMTGHDGHVLSGSIHKFLDVSTHLGLSSSAGSLDINVSSTGVQDRETGLIDTPAI